MTYYANTLVYTVDRRTPEAEPLRIAAETLRRGGLVAFPTETVYGLGANALDPAAVARIFDAKGRPSSDPLIVHIAALDQLDTVARDLPPLALDLAARFWPGPLTLVLARAERVAPNVSAGRDTVAVRMPSHPVALGLLQAAQLPVAAPSANLFAHTSPTTAQHVLDDLRDRVDLVLDGGPTSVGVESTVLDLTGSVPTVLRPGGLPIEALRAIIPDVVYTPQYLGEQESAQGPGMLLRHYSPHAQLLLYDGKAESVRAAMRAAALRLLAENAIVGAMAYDEDRAAFAGLAVEIVPLGPEANTEQISRRLYAAMRELDGRKVDCILARGPSRTGLGAAIWDRLIRAAEGRVIEVD